MHIVDSFGVTLIIMLLFLLTCSNSRRHSSCQISCTTGGIWKELVLYGFHTVGKPFFPKELGPYGNYPTWPCCRTWKGTFPYDFFPLGMVTKYLISILFYFIFLYYKT
jgi:hypothetical protein